MTKRSAKLRKILSLASSEEQRYGLATGRSRRYLDDQLERLGELNAYRQSYAEKARVNGQTSPAHWQDYQNFLQRLDQAVRSQQQIVKDSEQNLDAHRRRWMAKRRRLESLEQVLERYRRDEILQQDRQEQRAIDDSPAAGPLFPEQQDDNG